MKQSYSLYILIANQILRVICNQDSVRDFAVSTAVERT